ncbi:MAG: SRPBCC family protein [Actinobacteria bacterium]|nr:SRPBCC family protein [Actinomycetota bacterium]
MARTSVHALVPIERAFAAVADPRTYPEWLVGAKRIRDVDDGWPEPGTRFHHRVGLVGPLTLPDSSTVIEVDAPNRLVLEVRARPLLRGRVTYELARTDGSDGRPATRISMDERPLGRLRFVAPLLEPLIRGRNRASLNALVAFLNRPADGR